MMDIFWLCLALIALVGLLMLASAALTGYMVYRTKRENHETLIAASLPKRTGATNIDDLADDDFADDGLPETIRQMNEKLTQQSFATPSKEKK